jgi:phosphomannomutase
LPPKTVNIGRLMEASRVGFGTSGARGLVTDMTDLVCYAYTAAFIQHLEAHGELQAGIAVALAGDLRPSTGRIMNAVAKAVADQGHGLLNCGRIPSPAVAYYGIRQGIPGIMVTGSHIPDDRNGIKYNKAGGEILKEDEAGIRAQSVELPRKLFDENGRFREEPSWLPEPGREAYRYYVDRYLDFFPAGCLTGLRLGLYEHSAVSRECLYDVLVGLGAEVTRLGRSERFIPVDTEAIRPEDIGLARHWSAEHGFDALVSTDGDGDRPLISDENGEWLRGDVAGILCAAYLEADVVVTPVSSNTAVERCGLFQAVRRTRIGSPYVIAGMLGALAEGARRVVGYEANGGFLTGSDIHRGGRTLRALPTRDTLVVLAAILHLASERGQPVSRIVADLPGRFTASGRLKEFPTERARGRLAALNTGDPARDKVAIEALFGEAFGEVAGMDTTEGLRITFTSGEIVHLRPSGNAPEFRCYNEADSEGRALEMNRICLDIMGGWRSG